MQRLCGRCAVSKIINHQNVIKMHFDHFKDVLRSDIEEYAQMDN
jgi:hypothetical protein